MLNLNKIWFKMIKNWRQTTTLDTGSTTRHYAFLGLPQLPNLSWNVPTLSLRSWKIQAPVMAALCLWGWWEHRRFWVWSLWCWPACGWVTSEGVLLGTAQPRNSTCTLCAWCLAWSSCTATVSLRWMNHTVCGRGQHHLCSKIELNLIPWDGTKTFMLLCDNFICLQKHGLPGVHSAVSVSVNMVRRLSF